LVSSLLFGLVPALRIARPQLAEAMQAGGRAAGSAQHKRLRSAPVISQTAFGLVVLIGARLLVRSLEGVRPADLAFNPLHILTANCDLSQTRYNSDQQDQFYRELLRRLRTVPGVMAAGAAMPMPLYNDNWNIAFDLLDQPLPESERPGAGFFIASPGLFEAMQIPL